MHVRCNVLGVNVTVCCHFDCLCFSYSLCWGCSNACRSKTKAYITCSVTSFLSIACGNILSIYQLPSTTVVIGRMGWHKFRCIKFRNKKSRANTKRVCSDELIYITCGYMLDMHRTEYDYSFGYTNRCGIQTWLGYIRLTSCEITGLMDAPRRDGRDVK